MESSSPNAFAIVSLLDLLSILSETRSSLACVNCFLRQSSCVPSTLLSSRTNPSMQRLMLHLHRHIHFTFDLIHTMCRLASGHRSSFHTFAQRHTEIGRHRQKIDCMKRKLISVIRIERLFYLSIVVVDVCGQSFARFDMCIVSCCEKTSG